ncbi:MAG TPA: radical SAM protein [Clostridiaceae bacterium]|nr:radical SAM protein [Clostridiaceae bacterium]
MKKIRNATVDLLLRYLSNNPMEKLPTIFKIAQQLDREKMHTSQINGLLEILSDPQGIWYQFTKKLFEEVSTRSLQKFVECFLLNANLDGEAIIKEAEKKYDCYIPWAILMDPTSACNLSCTGCWAAQYGHKNNLSYETLDSIICQGKELGTYFYIFSGGEPLVRKDDLISLCKKHNDCYFLSFTNGTLVDDAFCKELADVGNFALAFSIEGDEEATDMRRGKGTYRKVIEAMKRMKDHKLLFGYSTCYHRHNTESVGSDEFVDDMIAKGCRFAWYFTYIPVGKDAVTDLLVTPEQRAYMYRRIREIRETKPIFALDFWNDGEYTHGCIAGGRRYIHINAAGDVEPCAFIHYSNVNIHDVSLLDALRSPLFKAYRKRLPFNENHLRPCPLLDNPTMLHDMVEESGAYSTEMEAPEDVHSLCAKTAPVAEQWAKCADMLWRQRQEAEKKVSGIN